MNKNRSCIAGFIESTKLIYVKLFSYLNPIFLKLFFYMGIKY